MARRNDHSRDELHRMVLEAAEALLDEAGPQGLSMRRIAQRIGYTHGTLYLIFSNLDALLAELNARTLGHLVNSLEAAAAAAAPGRAQLLALAQAYVDFARRYTSRWRLVFEHHPAADSQPPVEVDAQIQRGFRILAQAFEAPVSEDGLQAGAGQTPPRPGQDDGLGPAFWAAIHGVTVLALDDKLIGAAGEDLDAGALIARTVDVFLAAAR